MSVVKSHDYEEIARNVSVCSEQNVDEILYVLGTSCLSILRQASLQYLYALKHYTEHWDHMYQTTAASDFDIT